jgi:hypothetical protein
MNVAPNFGWLAGCEPLQLLDASIGTRYATIEAQSSSRLHKFRLMAAARRFAFDAPGALLLGAVAGVGLATVLARRLPGRVAVMAVGLGVVAFATAGLHFNLT